MSRTAEVLGALRDAGRPLDDEELAAATGINRHYVNAICRRLASDGMLLRRCGDTGKMLNVRSKARSRGQPRWRQ